ncbi:uncharacterized protein LOC130672074 [Microplitis mediator]|uniref:uncharacterized protein LOC130672074 n=1 Tax=Microplitis mediator TaxID=375433 RepID=UPI0025563F5B|nr:uncharacterized protein LOC130672074 [Microplitis mediator]XP_057332317.1 uncharacterized protein LOC130672074 [Microplitis mediator]
MDKNLHKAIVNYYLTFEKLYYYFNNEIRKVITEPLTSLKNQMEQLHHVSSSSVDNAEICELERVREKLIFKINLGIEDEIELIADVINTLNNYYQELKDKFIRLEQVYSKININDPAMINLVNGSSERPPLNLLMEWSFESFEYYTNLYNEIKNNYKLLNRTDEKSIEQLINSFNKTSNEKIRKISAFTQYLNNKVR